MSELMALFKRNFPLAVREDATAERLLSSNENTVLERRDEAGKLIAASVIHKSNILMLCVDEKYRHRGLGGVLLADSERIIRENGYAEATVGAGDDYLTPGVPMRTRPYSETLKPDLLYPELTDEAAEFFKKRGYVHSWPDANCFDMRVDLEKAAFPEASVGDTIDGVLYRWADVSDIPAIVRCTDDAEESFSEYYRDEALYADPARRVLVAEENGEICGTLMVCAETEGKGLGSVGCTTVMSRCQGRHIGVNMTVLGTKHLKSIGLKHGFLGYTYSGLDRMYGYAGYKICVYYYMGKKTL